MLAPTIGPREPVESGPMHDLAPNALVAVFVVACVAVPCVFWTGIDDVFSTPKLIVLWLLLPTALWLAAFVALRQRTRSRLRVRFVPLVDLSLAAFVGLTVFAFALSSDPHQSLYGEHLQHQGVLTLLVYVGFFYLARLVCSGGRRVGVVFGAVVLGATVVAGYAMLQRFGVDPIWHGYLPSGRVFSTIGQANALAAFLVLAIPITVASAVVRRGVARMVLLLAVAAMIASLVFTQSRAGYLALGVMAGISAVAWLTDRTLRSSAGALAFGLLVALVLVLTLVPGVRSSVAETWNRAVSATPGGNDPSTDNHLDLWKVAARIAEDHPLVGTGPETYPDQFPGYSRLVLPASHVAFFDQFRVESPHNVFLAVAAGAGMPALLAYLTLVAAVLVNLARAIRTTDEAMARVILWALVAATVGHMVTDFFMTAEVAESLVFWVLVGVAVAVSAESPFTWSPRSGSLGVGPQSR